MKNIYKADAVFSNKTDSILLEAKDFETACRIAVREFTDLKYEVDANDKNKRVMTLNPESVPNKVIIEKVKLRG